MADDDLDVESGSEAPKKKGGMRRIIILAVILIVVLAGAAVALMMFAPGLVPGLGEKPEAAKTGEAGGDTASGGAKVPELGVLHPMKTFIVNLMDPGGKRYLKITISLELENEELKAELDKRLPQIRDAILILLSSMTFEDISPIEGKMRLRRQMVNRCNAYLTTGKVKNIFFSEFVVQ